MDIFNIRIKNCSYIAWLRWNHKEYPLADDIIHDENFEVHIKGNADVESYEGDFILRVYVGIDKSYTNMLVKNGKIDYDEFHVVTGESFRTIKKEELRKFKIGNIV